jgi:hypothetical protein
MHCGVELCCAAASGVELFDPPLKKRDLEN